MALVKRITTMGTRMTVISFALPAPDKDQPPVLFAPYLEEVHMNYSCTYSTILFQCPL